MVEDMGNQDQDTYFAHYLLQAGATVVPTRPVDHQSHEAVVDNSDVDSPATGGFQVISGTWSNSTNTPYWSNNNGNDAVHYRFATAAATESAVARFTPNISVAGYYPVYAWAKPGTDRLGNQTFRINYPGGNPVEVPHTDFIALSRTGRIASIALPDDRWIKIGVALITSIEELKPSAA